MLVYGYIICCSLFLVLLFDDISLCSIINDTKTFQSSSCKTTLCFSVHKSPVCKPRIRTMIIAATSPIFGFGRPSDQCLIPGFRVHITRHTFPATHDPFLSEPEHSGNLALHSSP